MSDKTHFIAVSLKKKISKRLDHLKSICSCSPCQIFDKLMSTKAKKNFSFFAKSEKKSVLAQVFKATRYHFLKVFVCVCVCVCVCV